MEAEVDEGVLGPELAAALARKGYMQLTAVQQAVLDPALRGRDLRITSQTGSGKTLAIGFALRELVVPSQAGDAAAQAPPAAPVRGQAPTPPRALVVAPTRELARQTQQELQWLYADAKAHVVAITGGASYRDEGRELARGPRVIVGTPGRLLDHLNRGSIDASALAAVVLDEADRLLDMGFREDLDAILKHVPAEHQTHLVSATFPRGVRALADRVQRNAAHVEGTRLGAANVDIDHVLHVIEPRQKIDAIINLLLAEPEAQTLVFARTRADVAQLAQELVQAGLAATAISGELDQSARTRALSAFKRGRESVLVATDVAARGIDVQDVTRVIHAEPPTSADAYTHRSGRTGRAGRKGTSTLLVSLSQVVPVTRLLRAAGIVHRFEPVPSAESIRQAKDDALFAELTRDAPPGSLLEDARALALARKLQSTGHADRALARLLVRVRSAGSAEPREIREVARPDRGSPRSRPGQRDDFRRRDDARAPRDDVRGRGEARRGATPAFGPRAGAGGAAPAPESRAFAGGGDYVPFRVTWGGRQGADARRLLAIVCRRGQIRGSDVGAIRIEADASIVEVSRAVAASFAEHASQPDKRDKRVHIRALGPEAVRDRPQPEKDRPQPSRGKPAPSSGRAPLKRRR